MNRTRRPRASHRAPLLFALAFAACGGDPDAPAPAAAAAERAPAAQAPVEGERVHVLVSGALDGKLEPCGCAQGMAGGLPRRMAHVQESPVYDLLIEGGDLVADHTRLDLEKALTALQVLFQMPKAYDALGMGPRDLELPFGEWTGHLANFHVPVVASDLRSTTGGWPAVAFLERDVRGTKVRIASLAMTLPAAITSMSPVPLELLAPDAAWQRALQGADAATRRILLVHADPERVRKVAASLQPRPDLVVGVDDAYPEPPAAAEQAGGVPVVFPGIRGRFLLYVTLARAADGPRVTHYEPILLRGSETKPDAGQDPNVKELLLSHRQFVAQEGVLKAMADTSPPPNGVRFLGSAACQSCHPQDYATWRASKHGHAWQTLVDAEKDQKRYGWPVTRYPDCVSCHVIGYRRPGGFVTGDDTPLLVDVGCERCHGPGSQHVASQGKAKLGPVGNGLPSTVCTQCHDFEQTPDFDYNKRWPIIQHGAKAVLPGKAPK